jgi:hypothetical protein
MRALGFVDGAHLQNIQESHAVLLLDAGAERIVNSYVELLPAR